MNKFLKLIFILSLCACILFTILGIFELKNNNMSFEKFVSRLEENARNEDLAKNINNYTYINKKETVDLKNIDKIYIDSTVADIRVISNKSLKDKVNIKIVGSLNTDFADKYSNNIKQSNVLNIVFNSYNVSNTSISGINVTIEIPEDFNKELEIKSVSGDINIDFLN